VEIDPRNMDPKELDVRYGKPIKQRMVIATIGVEANENHDGITVEVLTDQNTRVKIPFRQDAVRDLVAMCADHALAPNRPKAN
jgi:hypothetical protein